MTTPFLDVLDNLIESRDGGCDTDKSDDDDNNDLRSTGKNCDADGENSSDEDHANLRQCLTDEDFPESENSDNDQDMNEAKNVSGGQGNVMAKESGSKSCNEAQGNESEELFSASEED